MVIPDNPSNNDIREALINLAQKVQRLEEKFDAEKFDAEEISQKIDRLDYKFDTYQKGTDGMVKMATTIIIATAFIVVLSNLTPAITAIVTALSAAK